MAGLSCLAVRRLFPCTLSHSAIGFPLSVNSDSARLERSLCSIKALTVPCMF